MKRHSVIRRCVLAAGLGLLLVGILAVSLAWGAIWPSPPVTALQSRAGGDVASPAAPVLPGVSTSGPAPQPVRADAGRTTQDISAKAAPAKPDAERAVREAWQRAREAGVYDFATHLSQVTYPARALANVGRGPSRAELHLEGEIDQPARTLAFRMWQPGTAEAGVSSPAKTSGSDAEARIEGDRAYVRPAGGDWKEVEDFSASFAPDNDPLAFLAGMVNVREMPAEELGSGGAEAQRSGGNW